ncbi:glutaminase [Corynebacterium guangdongense]|uniref:Glutaminase n=1 Tax=Corynebacterium guangdongense TaxID=1783348 RepID=A0ABU1ZZ12_9CORY|nr:glutaminase [Corynebacterium guangdongense]MDR7330146.1 glutaminase [Corynebacterium guangdongense]WJZ18704.1 Glutaminase 2 [Corynebacterium guangdongense]
MENPIPDYLGDILDSVRDDSSGEIPTYIPELAQADPEWLGLALCTTSGHLYSAGDDDVEFTIQSLSKPFAYALAIESAGMDAVVDAVGLEPSGEAFNELSLGEDGRPVNAMINAGAITVNQLINGPDSGVDERVEMIRDYFSRLAGRELEIDEKSAESELAGADRNLSLAHMLRSYDIITDSAQDAVLSYIRQCSVKVTVKDLAVMAGTLANGGVHPRSGEKLVDARVARLTLSVMNSSGMYDAAGRWQARVGIPAKSGVSGGIIGTLPSQLGIAALSPRLDGSGNSVRGVKAFEELSDQMGLHLMNGVGMSGSETVRTIEHRGGDSVVVLQGPVDFSAAEAALHAISGRKLTGERVVLDLERVTHTQPMGIAMLGEGLRRLREGGREIASHDPRGFLLDNELDDGTLVPDVMDLDA